MTDQETIKLCAEAMEIGNLQPLIHVSEEEAHGLDPGEVGRLVAEGKLGVQAGWTGYDPLHDDAQAMALMKKFHLMVFWERDALGKGVEWHCMPSERSERNYGSKGFGYSFGDETANAAICECVATMQLAKLETQT